jgi:hypothetical protein
MTKTATCPKEFVFVSPGGRLAIGIPFAYHQRPSNEEVDAMPGYRIMISPQKPEAWGLKISEDGFYTMLSPQALKNLKCLGEL